MFDQAQVVGVSAWALGRSGLTACLTPARFSGEMPSGWLQTMSMTSCPWVCSASMGETLPAAAKIGKRDCYAPATGNSRQSVVELGEIVWLVVTKA